MEEVRAKPTIMPSRSPPTIEIMANWKVKPRPPRRKYMFLEITPQSIIYYLLPSMPGILILDSTHPIKRTTHVVVNI